MKLHRAHRKPEWETTNHLNIWQRLARDTSGILTPANAITAIGFVLVCIGCVMFYFENYWPGLALIAIGRLCDIADGVVAEAAHVKSQLGELLDATSDKFTTLFVVITCFMTHVAPWGLLIVALLPQALSSALSIVAYARGDRLHPSRVGKISMVALWLCLGAFLFLQAAAPTNQTAEQYVSYATLATTVLGFWASLGYLRRKPIKGAL